MNNYSRYIIISFLLISPFSSYCQTLTEEDFKILIDGKYLNNTSISIPELLQLKEVSLNYKWLSFNNVEICIDFRTKEEVKHVYDGYGFFRCSGHTICSEAIKYFPKLRPTCTVTFMVENVVNKQGKTVNVPSITLIIK